MSERSEQMSIWLSTQRADFIVFLPIVHCPRVEHLLFFSLGVSVDVFPKIVMGGEALPASGFRAHEVQSINSFRMIGVDVVTELFRRRQNLGAMRARMTTARHGTIFQVDHSLQDHKCVRGRETCTVIQNFLKVEQK